MDAAWLTDRIERQFAEKRAEWLAAVTLAQRVFGRAKSADLRAACEAVASFPRHQALVLTLERMRIDRPGRLCLPLRASPTGCGPARDRRAAVVATAQAQGVLVILERAFSARVIDAATVRTAGDFPAVPAGAGSGCAIARPGRGASVGAMPGAIGAWMRSVLLPGLREAELSPDACLIRAVSGERTAGKRGTSGAASWEDQDYRVDLGAATGGAPPPDPPGSEGDGYR